jgi:hypothetical protein
MRTLTAITISAAVVALAAAGCGGGSSSSGGSGSPAPNPNAKESSPPGDIPDNQAFVAYRPPGGGFSVKVPEGWSRIASGGAVTFTDKLNAIRMESAATGSPLTVGRARAELPRIARGVKGFRALKVSAVSRTAGNAVRITYLAAAAPNAVTGKAGQDAVERYVFYHHGREVVLTLSGPKGADNVDPWRIVSDSVRWTR